MRRSLLLNIVFGLIATPAYAEPTGRWWTGAAQGTVEYGIKNDSAGSDEVYIACAWDHTSINFNVGGIDPKPETMVLVVIGADEWEMIADAEGRIATKSHVEADNFITLWRAMRAGSTMRVRLATGQSTVFTLRGAAKILSPKPCETDYYDR